MKFSILTPEHIAKTWEQRRQHFADFVDSLEGRFTVPRLLQDVVAGSIEAAGVDDGDRALCTIWFSVTDYHVKRALTVMGASGRGSGVHRWVHAARDGIEKVARKRGCHMIEGFGRRGYMAWFGAEARPEHIYFCYEVRNGRAENPE